MILWFLLCRVNQLCPVRMNLDIFKTAHFFIRIGPLFTRNQWVRSSWGFFGSDGLANCQDDENRIFTNWFWCVQIRIDGALVIIVLTLLWSDSVRLKKSKLYYFNPRPLESGYLDTTFIHVLNQSASRHTKPVNLLTETSRLFCF